MRGNENVFKRSGPNGRRWTNHGLPQRIEDHMKNANNKRWKEVEEKLQKMADMREEIEASSKIEDYIDGETMGIEFFENGMNSHRFTFPSVNYGIDKYESNSNLWHCYVIEFDNYDLIGEQLCFVLCLFMRF